MKTARRGCKDRRVATRKDILRTQPERCQIERRPRPMQQHSERMKVVRRVYVDYVVCHTIARRGAKSKT